MPSFAHQDLSDLHLNSFLDEKPIRFPSEWRLAHVMYAAGIFKSVNEAKRNGWNKPIETGYREYFVGKKKTLICVLNVWPKWEKFEKILLRTRDSKLEFCYSDTFEIVSLDDLAKIGIKVEFENGPVV